MQDTQNYCIIPLEQHKIKLCVTSEDYNTLNFSPILPDPLLKSQWSTLIREKWVIFFYEFSMAVAQKLKILCMLII